MKEVVISRFYFNPTHPMKWYARSVWFKYYMQNLWIRL